MGGARGRRGATYATGHHLGSPSQWPRLANSARFARGAVGRPALAQRYVWYSYPNALQQMQGLAAAWSGLLRLAF